MDKSEINSLLEKYLNGTSTPDENAVLETWYIRYEDKNLADIADEERIQQLDRIRVQVAKYSMPGKPDLIKKMISTWRLLEIAAAVAVIMFGVWFYTYQYESGINSEQAVVLNDLAPGKNIAMLTLSDGKVIQLSDAKSGVVIGHEDLKYSDGTDVKGASISLKTLTASTPKGGTYQITLPEGTRVWLNADSKLEFSADFGKGNKRVVKLEGEAYFEVAKMVADSRLKVEKLRRIPFIVISKVQETEVLGTHFNISAYRDEPEAKTTLLEGSVRVKSLAVRSRVAEAVLKPNQQALIHELGLEVKTVNASDAVAWKDGKFRFDKASLEDVMKQLARWYNVEVVYPNGIPDIKFSGGINRNVSAANALSLMQYMDVKFKIDGKKIIVTK